MKPSKGALSAERTTEILLLVDRIHRRMDFGFPPLRFEDFFKIFDSYRIFEIDLPAGVDSRLVLTPNRPYKTIYLRSQNSRPKLRFALAHAVIHAELHCRGKKQAHRIECRTSEHAYDGRRSVLEREAEFGATALLMPLWMIDRFVPYRSSTLYPERVIQNLARMFRVSEAAMQVQLRNYAAAAAKRPPATAGESSGRRPSEVDWMAAADSTRRRASAAGRAQG